MTEERFFSGEMPLLHIVPGPSWGPTAEFEEKWFGDYKNNDIITIVQASSHSGKQENEFTLSYHDALHYFNMKMCDMYEIFYAVGWRELLVKRQEYEL